MQYGIYNGKPNELYDDGRVLVDAGAKMYQPYKVYPMDPQRFQGSNHIIYKPFAPLNDYRTYNKITPMSDNEYGIFRLFKADANPHINTLIKYLFSMVIVLATSKSI